ncbi:MAG: hypothetical protein ACE5HD_01545 [Acidobacteriota bacterium]
MDPRQLGTRSPLRLLEQTIHGGLGQGNIGVVVARHGIGKTALLVEVALDSLIHGGKILHVSLQQTVDQIRAYYDEIFNDLAHTRDLENVWQVRLDLERNRRIHSHLDGKFSEETLQKTLAFMRTYTDFSPSMILVDGFNFEEITDAILGGLRRLAHGFEAELWMTAVTTRDAPHDQHGVPEPVARVASSVDVILRLAHDGDRVHVSLLKDHARSDVPRLKLALDPRTLLLVKE